MTTEQTIQKIITRINKEWQAEAKLAIARLYELMKQGKKVEEAIKVIEKEYPKLFDIPALRPALLEAAAYGYGIMPEVLTTADEALWASQLTLPWDASGMKLSEKLHGVKKQMHKRIADTVAEQLRKNTSWQDKAKALYDGYTNNSDVIRPQDIAKYMKVVRRATEGDKQALRAQRQALNNIIRLAKNGAPNKALRSAYAKLLQAVQFGTDKQIAKACEVAINEKSRYVAERIIRTEMARAWADGFWSKALNDDDVIAVKFKLSTRHPVFDICDMYAKADMYGLGAGVFPKNKVPALPIHPHCLCRYVELYKGELDMSQKHEQIQQAGDKWLRKLPKEKQMLVLGTDGLREWRKGADWRNYMRGWNGLRKADTRLTQARYVRYKDKKHSIIEPFYKGNTDISMKRIHNGKIKTFIDDEAGITLQELDELNYQLKQSAKLLNIKIDDSFPRVIITTPNKMGNFSKSKMALGNYEAISNTLYVNKLLLSFESRMELLRSGDVPVSRSKLSTIVHELYHLLDARAYSKKYGKITDQEKYVKDIIKISKVKVDELEEKRYNIMDVSSYARKAMFLGRYDEAYTEYRTKQRLKNIKVEE